MTKLIAFFVASATLLAAAPSFADTAWERSHPRRDQVNDRLEHQNDRIRDGRADGSLTPRESRRLHREDHAIRAEERGMAAEHGGHITRRDQRILNRQENRVS